MKKLLTLIFCILFSTLTFAEAEIYTIDPKHSEVTWSISHLGFSNTTGKWMVEGSILIDEENPENSKVSVKIPMNLLVTGVTDLDDHLKAPLFFDAKKYPSAAFESEKVTMDGKTKATVEGQLTLRGVSKPVVLKIELNKKGFNPIADKMAVGFSGTANIKRSDFGMKALLPSVPDNVKINIEVEAFKQKSE